MTDEVQAAGPVDRRLGDHVLSGIGLGCAGWSADDRDEDQALVTLAAALNSGVRVFDTARSYTTTTHPSHNEGLLSRGLVGHLAGQAVLVVTKGGSTRIGLQDYEVCGRPEVLITHVEQSLRALERDQLELYLLHWPDPDVPIEDSVGALAEQQRLGKIKHLGISNVDHDQLCRAAATARIAAVENSFSPFDLRHRSMVEHCRQTRTLFLAYSPLGGSDRSSTLHDRLPGVARLAAEHRRSVHQLVLTWELALSDTFIALVGARRPSSINDAAEAMTFELPCAELEIIDREINALTTEEGSP